MECLPCLSNFLKKEKAEALSHNFVTFYRREMMNKKCLEVISEKILQVQSLRKTCIFPVIVTNGIIIVLIMFKAISIIVLSSQKLSLENIFSLLILISVDLSKFDLTLMWECKNQFLINLLLSKLNKFLILLSSAFLEKMQFKLHSTTKHLSNRLLWITPLKNLDSAQFALKLSRKPNTRLPWEFILSNYNLI